MRKPHDYDTELKALSERAAQLRRLKIQQLGELVIACRADALPIELLAGALVAAADERNGAVKEGWRKAGVRFFQGARRASDRAADDGASASPGGGGALPRAGANGAA